MKEWMDKMYAIEEFSLTEFYKFPENKGTIDEIVSLHIEPRVEKLEFIDSREGKNIKGEVFEGKKGIISVEFKVKMRYTNLNSSEIHSYEMTENNFLQINSFANIKNIAIEDLNRKEKLKVKIIINDINAKKIDRENFSFALRGNACLY